MFKYIIFLVVSIGLGWFLREYFTVATQENKVMTSIKNLWIEPKSIESRVTTNTKEFVHKNIRVEKISQMTLNKLLSQNRFYDALAYYLDASDDNVERYKKQIEAYLAKLARKDATMALEFMQVFLDNVPESKILTLMIETNIIEGYLPRAIELIRQAKENYSSDTEDTRLSIQLKNVAIKHIDILMKREDYALLISFLEEMIAYESTDSFYTFNLAELYLQLDKNDEATVLLHELQYDEVYAHNVKTILENMEKENNRSDYTYALPLKRYGNHYVVEVFLDGTAFNLMLDTGATYIFIDEDKASELKVINYNLILKTAGNEINAKLCEASVLEVGNIRLENIKVTVAPFKRDGIDGLLGMNFFKHFKFFINQDEGILYLEPKN